MLDPAALTAAPNTFGNAPRTIGASPGARLFVLSIIKNTRIFEGLNAQFRIDVDGFNTPIFQASRCR